MKGQKSKGDIFRKNNMGDIQLIPFTNIGSQKEFSNALLNLILEQHNLG